jgi:Do/DeqQ family serine protease
MRSIWLIFAQTVTVLVAALFVVLTFRPQWLQGWTWRQVLPQATVAVAPPTAQSGASSGGTGLVSFREAAQRASPAVVSIVTSASAPNNPHQRDPWFRYFFGDRQAQPQSGVGSGVIVSPEGYILTNNHVIDRMDDIEVMLSDGRKASAKVIGSDPDTDLAVLKVELTKVPSIVFGDSDVVQVGDAVLAIGNPFGVGQTVTSGIVSALGRNQLGINTFENFIQTDAAINPGNSGGALVDARGNLIGINTAIYSRSGGNMGIGFAIPVSTARMVMDSLIRDGAVTRGWIGVEPRDLTPEMAETFNLPMIEGVLITGVLHNGPAATGGVRPGDVVVQVGPHRVANTAQLLNAVASLKPGEQAEVTLQRGDKQRVVTVVVGTRPRQPVQVPREEFEEE